MVSEDCTTNPNYWDCECKEKYIHQKYEVYCPLCGSHCSDQPDSRIIEVEAAGLPPGLPPHTEFCNRCGESVAPGSGKFVNRVPDLNSIQARIDSHRPHPAGAYVCAECDAKTSDTVDSMVCPHCKKTITYLETIELASCDISLEPRNDASLDIKYSCYECGKEIEFNDIPGQDHIGCDMYEL